MKNLKNLLLTLSLFLMTVLTVNATTTSTVEVKVTQIGKTKTALVEITGISAESIIRLKDENDVVLLQQVANGTEFNKAFNFSQLTDATYDLIVTTQTRELVQPIKVADDQITANPSKMKTYYSPVVNVHESLIDLSWFNGKISSMKVQITDLNGSIVFADDIKNVFKVEKRYNMKQFRRGDYVVVIETPYKRYYENITLR
ncbi:MAG: hypothetical protein AAFO07_23600 [Bacteroidota bacterium]